MNYRTYLVRCDTIRNKFQNAKCQYTVKKRKILKGQCFIEGHKYNDNMVVFKAVSASVLWTGVELLLCSGDVEVNPGPDLMLGTQNCRGLKKESKLRQLLNRINKANNVNIIFALQETHIEVSKLKYQWRGKHIFTPGTGQQGG